MKTRTPLRIGLAVIAGIALGVAASRLGIGTATGGHLAGVAQERGLSGPEAEAALRTFVAPGDYDDYFMFASGGHSGQMYVIGVPSMRLLKTIPVFTPDSWSGYGFGTDAGDAVLEAGTDPAKSDPLRWGDTHHPALSETNGDYDGRFLYINDRANGRLGMIDLRDFKTKQIVDIPNIQSSHGGVFATPNTEYVHISSKTPRMVGDGAPSLDDYSETFRGYSTFVAIDQQTGKADLSLSFQIELPPYNQDLADAGKLVSEGWAFINSYNTEMAVGTEVDGEPLERGSIKNDYDFLHLIDWKKAEQVVADGKYDVLNGVRVISLQTAIDEGLLWFIEEPRNPHGIDVSPDGNYLVVSGKLDPNVSIYSFERIRSAISERNLKGTDPFGVPILQLDAVLEAQVEVGGGPLHTQFDNQGNAYTSLFVESGVAKWTLGPLAGVPADRAFILQDKIAIHYNIGHLVTAHGDTVAPHGKYLVALNKWSVDRFPTVGTLHPQNFQLVDIEAEQMQLLADMPIGMAEPHYVQMVQADRLTNAIRVYEPGTDPLTMAHSEHATEPGQERVVRDGNVVDVYMTAMRSHFTPDVVRVKEGDTVRFHITNIETADDATHGFAIPGYNVQGSLDPGEVVSVEVQASRTGAFGFYCTEFCSALHLEMQGWLLVEP